MGYTMRTDRHRLTVWLDRWDHSKVDAIELYDHETDPQEDTNLATSAAHASLVERLTEQWRRLSAPWRRAGQSVAATAATAAVEKDD